MVDVRAAEQRIARVLRCVEIVDDRLSVAADFVASGGLAKNNIVDALRDIEGLLAAEDVSNADIKGMLNRIDAWRYESPFGADAKAARKHLEASRDALAAWIKAT